MWQDRTDRGSGNYPSDGQVPPGRGPSSAVGDGRTSSRSSLLLLRCAAVLRRPRSNGARGAALAVIFGAFAITVAVSGCTSVGFSTVTFGAASVDDLKAEFDYKNVYSAGMVRLSEDLQPFHPSGSSPGVCNAGGVAAACIAADRKASADMGALVTALESVKVPPRFVVPDRLLRSSLAQEIQGLGLRDQALETGSDELWQQQAAVLKAATSALQDAYNAFPADNRPVPAP